MKKNISYLLILLLIFHHFSIVSAYNTGTWNPTGNMSIARARHTLTRLLDGKALVAGGLTTGGITTDVAEVYDPTTGTWSATGSMKTARSRHTATLLLDGRILVVGGKSSSGLSLDSAELYDPTTGTWQFTGSMAVPRDNHEAILLGDGKVLVMGGVSGANGGSPVEKSAEIYDPNTGTWSMADHMANSRYLPQAVLLSDGRVLVTGGYNASAFHTPMNTTEIYDPVVNRWSNADNMKTARATHNAILLANGNVLVAGGWTYPVNVNSPTATTEIYDPINDSWSQAGNLNIARASIGGAMVRLSNGWVLVAGGSGISGALASSELFDPASGVWILAGNFGTPRGGLETVLLSNGLVLNVGGGNQNGPVSTSDIYTP